MFDLPSRVTPAEWATLLVLLAASSGAAVRVALSAPYPRAVSGGIVALLLAADALLVWALFRNDSIRRQRALRGEAGLDYRR